MGDKRLKLARGLGGFVPQAMTFSQLEHSGDENEMEYDPGDQGLETARIENDLAYEEMIITVLANLELREKLVFVFQLLRDNGHQIDHAAFAKAIHLSRRQYMRVLDSVRMKSILFIRGYQTNLRSQQSHKEE